ncbi:MAG: hypothetical protein F4Y44_00755 [Chloroflexi bacterium]|nr:hypothetical protein [Chloroflexota bacterium]
MAGWLIIDNLESQNRSGRDAKILAGIAEVNNLSGTLAAAAAAAAASTNSRMTPESIAEARTATTATEAQLAELLADMEEQGYNDSFHRMRQQVDLLSAGMSQIEDERPALFEALIAGERSWQQLLFFHQPEASAVHKFQAGQSVLLHNDRQKRFQRWHTLEF